MNIETPRFTEEDARRYREEREKESSKQPKPSNSQIEFLERLFDYMGRECSPICRSEIRTMIEERLFDLKSKVRVEMPDRETIAEMEKGVLAQAPSIIRFIEDVIAGRPNIEIYDKDAKPGLCEKMWDARGGCFAASFARSGSFSFKPSMPMRFIIKLEIYPPQTTTAAAGGEIGGEMATS